MKKLLVLLLLLGSFLSYGQVNLVPNPSFENYSTCPDNENQVDYSTGWSNFLLTPDYYNSCSSNSNYSTPSNQRGYQVPATGSAYAGFFGYWSPYLMGDSNIREHIACQLSSPLNIGQKYYVSIRMSLTTGINGGCACSHLGAKFTTSSFAIYGTDSLSSPLVDNSAHVYYPNVISDTLNWTTISGSFVADSAYQYMVLGNFFMDSQVDTLLIGDTTGAPSCYAYYYVDDICVSTDSMQCAVASVQELTLEDATVYPNPFTDKLMIKLKGVGAINEFSVYDMYGNKQKVDITEINYSNHTIINMERGDLKSGIYFLTIKYWDNRLFQKKIIIK